MTIRNKNLPVICFLLSSIFLIGNLAFAQAPLPQGTDQPVNVVGTWMIEARNWDGQYDNKTIDLKQNGSVITGHFKGPNQSGSLEGSINEHHIVFRTKTRHPLTFRGRVDGDTMQGTYHVMGREGEFHGWRSKPN